MDGTARRRFLFILTNRGCPVAALRGVQAPVLQQQRGHDRSRCHLPATMESAPPGWPGDGAAEVVAFEDVDDTLDDRRAGRARRADDVETAEGPTPDGSSLRWTRFPGHASYHRP